MRKLLIVGLVAIGIAATTGTTKAEAAVTWPAHCTNMICVNAHMNNLDTRLRLQSARISNNAATTTSRFACISPRTFYRQYTYDYYGNYFPYLDLSNTYGQNTVAGPFTMLYDSCGGSF